MSSDPPSEEDLKLKRHALVQKDWELFNAYAKDLRDRGQTLIKSVLIISGGALTLSAGLFLRVDRPKIEAHLIPTLSNAWYALGFAMVAMLALLVWGIGAASTHSHRWRKHLEKPSGPLVQPRMSVEWTAWIIGGVGLAAFVTGLSSLVYIARSML